MSQVQTEAVPTLLFDPLPPVPDSADDSKHSQPNTKQQSCDVTLLEESTHVDRKAMEIAASAAMAILRRREATQQNLPIAATPSTAAPRSIVLNLPQSSLSVQRESYSVSEAHTVSTDEGLMDVDPLTADVSIEAGKDEFYTRNGEFGSGGKHMLDQYDSAGSPYDDDGYGDGLEVNKKRKSGFELPGEWDRIYKCPHPLCKKVAAVLILLQQFF